MHLNRRRKFRLSFKLLLLIALIPFLAHATDTCRAVLNDFDRDDLRAVTGELWAHQRFASQHDHLRDVLEEADGPCATVTAANFIQVILSMQPGGSPYDTDDLVKQIFDNYPDLKKGFVTDEQYIDLLEGLQQFLPGIRYKVEALKASDYSELPAPPLELEPRQVKLITYHYARSGTYLGRHFAMLQGMLSERRMTLIDPYSPNRRGSSSAFPERNHLFDLRKHSSADSDFAKWKFLLDIEIGATPNDRTLDTIFTITFE